MSHDSVLDLNGSLTTTRNKSCNSFQICDSFDTLLLHRKWRFVFLLINYGVLSFESGAVLKCDCLLEYSSNLKVLISS
jgi:hypothetical protein